jgi:ABC-2 type transport system permease protein
MNTITLGLRRAVYETRIYFRQGDTIFFTFLFPIVMLSIFSVAFSATGNVGTNPDGSGGISQAAFYLPGMIAAGILLSGVQNLAVDIAVERGDPPGQVVSYFVGKIGQVLITSLLQIGLLLLIARFAFDVALPADGGKWLTFAWVYLLGIMTSAVLGIALSRIPRTGKSATAVIIPIVLVLQFISGVYLQFSVLPIWLQNTASVFPLKWMAQGMRSVFLPESFARVEQGDSWNLSGVAIALLVWLVVGLVAARFTFRWIRKDA